LNYSTKGEDIQLKTNHGLSLAIRQLKRGLYDPYGLVLSSRAANNSGLRAIFPKFREMPFIREKTFYITSKL